MNLTDEQLQVIRATESSIICLAGPGSGKTTTLIARMERLIREGVEPKDIAVVTYTNAAAKVLETRLYSSGHSEKPCGKLGHCGTLHALMLKLLRKREALTLIDEEQRNEMLEQVISEMAWKGSMKLAREEIAKGPPPMRNRPMSKVEILAASFYQKLRGEQLITFDGCLHEGLALLKVLRGTSSMFHTLMVDEIQDAASIDYEIYETMEVRNRFYVGDADQQLMGFRGADIVPLLYRAGFWKVYKLEQNFRSDQHICRLANTLIAHNLYRVPKKIMPVSQREGFVNSTVYETSLAEYAGVAEEIISLLKAKVSRLAPSEIAVLARTNYLVQEFRYALESAGVPVSKPVLSGLPSDWKRTKLYLALLENPENDRLAYMALKEVKPSIADTVKRDALANFQSINQRAFKLELGMNFTRAFATLGLMGISQESIARLDEVTRLLPADSNLSDLMLAIGLKESEGDKVTDGVTVTTFHKAKGREFEVVFMPAIEKGILPIGVRDSDIEEERRCALVGISRAKRCLYLSCVRVRKGQFTEAKPTEISQFWTEMTT